MENKYVIITGGARGIGKAIATEFLRHSFDVIIVDVLEADLLATQKELSSIGSIHTYIGDITDINSVSALKEKIAKQHGKIYALVNNAATFSVVAPVQDAEPTKWLRDINVNLNGAFLMTHFFLPDLIEKREGYVINMISTGGVGDPHPYCTSYACSKAGVMRLTEGLGQELKDSGVFTFALAPPAVATKMTEFLMDDKGAQKYRPNFKRYLTNPDDSASPEDVAKQAVKLVTETEAQKLSGRLIKVKDDLSELLKTTDSIIEKDLRTLRIRY